MNPVKAWLSLEVDGADYVIDDVASTNYIKWSENNRVSLTFLASNIDEQKIPLSKELEAVALGRRFKIVPQDVKLLLEGVMHSTRGKLKDRHGFPPGWHISAQIPGESDVEADATLPDVEIHKKLTLVYPGHISEDNQFCIHEGGDVEVSPNLTQGQTIMVRVTANYPEVCKILDDPVDEFSLHQIIKQENGEFVYQRYDHCKLPQKRLPVFGDALTIEIVAGELAMETVIVSKPISPTESPQLV